MSGARTKSGLVCSHGSMLDNSIPRPKMPKTALPQCLRKKMGFEPRNGDDDTDIYKPGNGVLQAAGSAPDGSFLKRRSGAPMSQRASALAQQTKTNTGARAVITKARVNLNGNDMPVLQNIANRNVMVDKKRRRSLDNMKRMKQQCNSEYDIPLD